MWGRVFVCGEIDCECGGVVGGGEGVYCVVGCV